MGEGSESDDNGPLIELSPETKIHVNSRIFFYLTFSTKQV